MALKIWIDYNLIEQNLQCLVRRVKVIAVITLLLGSHLQIVRDIIHIRLKIHVIVKHSSSPRLFGSEPESSINHTR